jgi:hypothetical protein
MRTEAVACERTIALMETLMRTVEPVVGTRTPVVLDRWSCATCLWRAARDRGFLLTTGRTSTRWLRSADESTPHGWRWLKRRDDLAGLSPQDGVQTSWPRGGKAVSTHVVTTSVRTLSWCQVVSVRHSLSAPLSQARYWASCDLEADLETLRAHLSARWDRDVLTASGKEARGLDHSQVMRAQAQVALAVPWPCWSPSRCEHEQHRVHVRWQRPVTSGDARREIPRRHRHRVLCWLHEPFLSGVHPDTLSDVLAA